MLRLSFAYVYFSSTLVGVEVRTVRRAAGEVRVAAAAPPPRIAHDAVFFARQRG